MSYNNSAGIHGLFSFLCLIFTVLTGIISSITLVIASETELLEASGFSSIVTLLIVS